MTKLPYKPLNLAPVAIETHPLPDGGLVMRSRHELRPYPRCLGELLRHWAGAAPERAFLAERDSEGGWRRVSYGEALESVERIASALLERGLGEDRPVALLSDNGVDHGLLQLAALHVGIPAVPVSPAYSLLSEDHAQLRYIFERVRPGLVYAADGDRFAKALSAVSAMGPVEIVTSSASFGALLETSRHPSLDDRFATVGPDTVAKILFTSGSTGKPKGVINTQRMLCSNQQALAQAWPFLEERPPVLVDWLPWSHTFGGNHNFNLALRNGGTLYVDGGKAAPGLIETTVRNLQEVPSTFHFNVPRGFEMLIPLPGAGRRAARDLLPGSGRPFLCRRGAAAAPLGEAGEAVDRGDGPASRHALGLGLDGDGAERYPDPLPDRAGRRHRPARSGH
jgi:feruloyl-CoA synthase